MEAVLRETSTQALAAPIKHEIVTGASGVV